MFDIEEEIRTLQETSAHIKRINDLNTDKIKEKTNIKGMFIPSKSFCEFTSQAQNVLQYQNDDILDVKDFTITSIEKFRILSSCYEEVSCELEKVLILFNDIDNILSSLCATIDKLQKRNVRIIQNASSSTNWNDMDENQRTEERDECTYVSMHDFRSNIVEDSKLAIAAHGCRERHPYLCQRHCLSAQGTYLLSLCDLWLTLFYAISMTKVVNLFVITTCIVILNSATKQKYRRIFEIQKVQKHDKYWKDFSQHYNTCK